MGQNSSRKEGWCGLFTVSDTMSKKNLVSVKQTLCGPLSKVFLLTLTQARGSKSQTMKKEVVMCRFRQCRIKFKRTELELHSVGEHSESAICKCSFNWHKLFNIPGFQFPHPSDGENNNICGKALFGVTEKVLIMHLHSRSCRVVTQQWVSPPSPLPWLPATFVCPIL